MGLTVIDIGCADHGGDRSVDPLLDEFQPDRLIGYDPLADAREILTGSCHVSVRKRVAGLHDGTVEFLKAGLGSHVEPGTKHWFRCDDIRRVIREEVGPGERLIVKMDAEMSEYTLLPAMIDADLDTRIELLLIEWHCPFCKHGEWSHSEMCEMDGPNVVRASIEKAWHGEMREWTR